MSLGTMFSSSGRKDQPFPGWNHASAGPIFIRALFNHVEVAKKDPPIRARFHGRLESGTRHEGPACPP
jgi:hypothetical protein